MSSLGESFTRALIRAKEAQSNNNSNSMTSGVVKKPEPKPTDEKVASNTY